jgi:hypothetical protein
MFIVEVILGLVAIGLSIVAEVYKNQILFIPASILFLAAAGVHLARSRQS